MKDSTATIPSLKPIAYLSLAAMALLFIGGIVFYKERVFFADAAYVLFSIINYKAPAIQFGRYGSFITQLVPYLGEKLHLPLKAILIGYSASFGLFYLTVVSVIVFRYKQYRLAIITALFYFLFVSQSYYWVSEIPQGVGWMFLMFGTTLHMGKKRSHVLLILIPFVVFGGLAIFTHFVIIYALLFLWVYLIIEKENWPFSNKRTILFSVVIAVLIGAKFLMAYKGTDSTEETSHLYGVTHFSLQDIIDCFRTPVVQVFLKRCISNYWVSVVVFVLGIAALIKTKKKLLAIWTILSCLGYFIIIGLTYASFDGGVFLFHIESEWVCIGIFAATPFVLSFLPLLKPRPALVLVVVVFIARTSYIGAALPVFNDRVEFREKIFAQMEKKGISKLALFRDTDTKPIYMLDWATQYESMLTSSVRGNRQPLMLTFVDQADTGRMKVLTPEVFNPEFAITYNAKLNERYFRIDTMQPFHIMSYKELFR